MSLKRIHQLSPINFNLNSVLMRSTVGIISRLILRNPDSLWRVWILRTPLSSNSISLLYPQQWLPLSSQLASNLFTLHITWQVLPLKVWTLNTLTRLRALSKIEWPWVKMPHSMQAHSTPSLACKQLASIDIARYSMDLKTQVRRSKSNSDR